MKRWQSTYAVLATLGMTTLLTPTAPSWGAHPSRSAETRPTISLNAATSRELRQLPGIGELMAQRIIAARPYRSLDDLRRVSGMTPKRYTKLKDKIRL
ncbi:helix-hairpin-helix domain-containing protein [bacterium]|nr:helix-hairpin-helix domain-containing protein [bacterium]